MQTELHAGDQTKNGANAQDVNTCPNCGALMPSEMRFCRSCGCRLGEGVEEYTETVRFQERLHTAPRRKSRTASAAASGTSPTGVRDWGAVVAPGVAGQSARSLTCGLDLLKRKRRRHKRLPRWMMWVFIGLFITGITNGLFSRSDSHFRGRTSSSATANASSSFLGSHYKTANGGAFVQDIMPPGSAADRAGLLGGDVITSFDGKPVKSESDLSNLLTNTPVGKTVDVSFIRDGETKTVKLVTVSETENERLQNAFDDAPKGFLGVNDNFKRVQIPGTNLYGVQLNEVYKNRPGYLAGLRDGDIVIQFGETPIRTAEELNSRIDRAQPESTVKVIVMRGGERLEISVKMGEDD